MTPALEYAVISALLTHKLPAHEVEQKSLTQEVSQAFHKAVIALPDAKPSEVKQYVVDVLHVSRERVDDYVKAMKAAPQFENVTAFLQAMKRESALIDIGNKVQELHVDHTADISQLRDLIPVSADPEKRSLVMERDGEDFIFKQDLYAMRLELRNLYRTRGDLQAEATVFVGDKRLLNTQMVLQWQNKRRAAIQYLEERRPGLPWEEFIEEAVYQTINSFRSLPEVVWEDDQQYPAIEMLVAPFVVKEGVSMLYADGDTGKSYLAMLIAALYSSGRETAGIVAMESGNALYIDFETGENTFKKRMASIRLGNNLPRNKYSVGYMGITDTSLANARREIHSVIQRTQAGLVIVDSLIAASGGAPESVEDIRPTLEALRSFKVPTLVLHHVPKLRTVTNGIPEPFGSVSIRNTIRWGWYAEKAESEDRSRSILTLKHGKHNDDMQREPFGLCANFSRTDAGTVVEYTPYSLELITSARDDRMIEKVSKLLNSEPPRYWSYQEVADCVGYKSDTIRKLVNNNKNVFSTLGRGRPGMGLVEWGGAEQDDVFTPVSA